MVVIGLLTGLSLLSASNGPLTGGWVAWLRTAFGLGAYLFPGTLIVAGLWLVLRDFERIPRLAGERLLGIALLFFNILAILHFLLLDGEMTSQELAQSGGGGGIVGGLVYQGLTAALGSAGAAVALLAWLAIALLLVLSLTVLEMGHRFSPWWSRLQAWTAKVWQDFRSGPTPRAPESTLNTLLTDGFTPTRESLEEQPTGGQPAVAFDPSAAAAAFASSQPPRRLWILPSVENILEAGSEMTYDNTVDERRSQIIEDTLASFGAPVKVVEVNRGPTITQFGVEPDFVADSSGWSTSPAPGARRAQRPDPSTTPKAAGDAGRATVRRAQKRPRPPKRVTCPKSPRPGQEANGSWRPDQSDHAAPGGQVPAERGFARAARMT